MQENKSFGSRVKNRRIELNLSQEDLAKKLGYKSRSSINKIELCIHDLSNDKIVQISKALQTTPETLLGWSDNEFKLTAEVKVVEEIQKQYGSKSVELLSNFTSLNETGQEKAIELVSDLTLIQKYKK